MESNPYRRSVQLAHMIIVHIDHLYVHSALPYHLGYLDQAVHHYEHAQEEHYPQQTHRYYLVAHAWLLVAAVKITVVLKWADKICLELALLELYL